MTQNTYIHDYIISTLDNQSKFKFSLSPIQGEDAKYHYLYLTTNDINQRYYIGIHTSHKQFDKQYRGSGKALRQAFTKYGRENFTTVAIAYFYNKLDLEKAEQLVVTVQLLIEQNGIIYNLKSGGINGSINRQHSAFMRQKMSDPQYIDFWVQRCEFYQQHPELSKVNCGKETEEQKKERYQKIIELRKRRNQYLQQNEPELWNAMETKRIKRVKEELSKPVRVFNLKDNTVTVYSSMNDAERQLGFSIRTLIRGSERSEKSGEYRIEFVNQQDAEHVQKIEYKEPDYSAQEKPITAFDPFGNIVKQYKSTSEAIRDLQLSADFVFKTAIEKHHFVRGCFWDYTNESDRLNCNYQPQSKQRMVYACDENWNPIEFYVCMSDACRKYGFDKQTLKNHIQNKKLLKGKFWKWVNKQSETYVMNHQTLPDLRKRVGGSLKKDGDVVIEFESAQAASKYCNKCVSAVSISIRTGWRCGGYYWRYLD